MYPAVTALPANSVRAKSAMQGPSSRSPIAQASEPISRHHQVRPDFDAVEARDNTFFGWIWNSAWTLLVLANIFWGGNIIVGRAILGPVPPIALSFWRWTGAFAVAFWFAWPHLKVDRPVLLAHWKIMLILAATGMGFFNIIAYVGLAGTTALN